ncbi:hypothetical protein [Haloterrigena alkaliphila]|uniref:hypothetical protein n=1 Tax=Haloterrigena alkaliphila TaxID=2816475 RepID=UPI001D001558|nr:hypothetical protein [Haloterrigena alkaliphila]UHQ95382.1 hypothetical protein J0X25_20410 [Haloterrigena alkaliphila]
MTDATVRRSRLVSISCFALWGVSVMYFSYYAFVVGASSDHRLVAERFARAPETGIEPLVALAGSTIVLWLIAMLSLAYYGYTQWRYARRRRRALERTFERGRTQ